MLTYRLAAHIAVLGVVLFAAVGTVAAQGVTATEIILGRTADFSGQTSGPVKEGTHGAMLYIDWVNANGGVHGRKIVIEALDDGFDPKRAAANATTLIEQKQVLAIFFNRGTPHSEAILPIAMKHGVPLIAPSTGAALLRRPGQPAGLQRSLEVPG